MRSSLLEDWSEPRPTLVALAAEESDVALSFRNLARVSVLAHENVGVADLLGAASLVLSQAALDALTARAGGGKEAKGVVQTPAPKAAAKDSGSKAPPKGAGSKAAADAPAASVEETPQDDPGGAEA